MKALAQFRRPLAMIKRHAHRAAIAVSALLALALLTAFAQHVYLAGKPGTYLTARVVRADLENAVMTTGTLQAYQQVDVGAQVSGQLKSLKVRLGDHVAKGQLLAEIDPALSQNALRSAQASLESLAAQRRAVAASMAQAELAYRRQQEMIAQEATSRQELEAAKAQLLVLRANLASFDAQISQARSQVDSAQTNLAYTSITAPIDGDVVAIVTQEGQTVVAAQQAPVILKLANLDTMTVKAQVSEADVIRIRPGQTAYFTILGDAAERHFGQLGAIEPAPQDYLNGTGKPSGPVFYNALFNAANAGHDLRIAMTAQVTVVLAEAKNALCVPLSALGKRTADGRYAIRVVGKDGRLATLSVAVGINDRVRIQVLDGLAEGDEVITETGTGKDAAAGAG
jgi:macrolide-specific efflux system membrane fusion protein